MSTLRELQKLPNLSDIKIIQYKGNQEEINKWLDILTLHYPHIKRINCADMDLCEIIYFGTGYLYCQNNQLTHLICPLARIVNCANNKLTTLTCLAAIEIYCSNNFITKLICPIARKVICNHNCLNGAIEFPRAYEIDCSHNKIRYLHTICVRTLNCSHNNIIGLHSCAIFVNCEYNDMGLLSGSRVETVHARGNRLEYIGCPKLNLLDYEGYSINLI